MDFSQEKKQSERKDDPVRFLAFEVTPKSGTIVRFGISFLLSIFVTVPHSLMRTNSNDELFQKQCSYIRMQDLS